MPKPLPILIEVEEVAFGKIWRQLRGTSGVVSVNIDPAVAKRGPYNKNGAAHGNSDITRAPKAGAKNSIRSKLLKLMSDGKHYNTKELSAALKMPLVASRRNADNAERGGHVKRIAPGTFVISAKGRDWLKQVAGA